MQVRYEGFYCTHIWQYTILAIDESFTLTITVQKVKFCYARSKVEV